MDAAIDGIVRRGGEEEADGGGADDASASESGVSDASESSGVSDARSDFYQIFFLFLNKPQCV